MLFKGLDIEMVRHLSKSWNTFVSWLYAPLPYRALNEEV